MISVERRLKHTLTITVMCLMISSVAITSITTASFPLIKETMLNYKDMVVECKRCIPPPVCNINGTILGEEFDKVDNYYTLPVSSAAFVINFVLAMRICGSRFINLHCTTFFFFCLFVFPIRFMFLAMQTLEFTRIGGDSYTLLIYDPEQFDCSVFTGYVDAVFLLHIRFFLLLADFITFHILIVCVPLFYVDDKLDGKIVRFGDKSKVDRYTQALAKLLASGV